MAKPRILYNPKQARIPAPHPLTASQNKKTEFQVTSTQKLDLPRLNFIQLALDAGTLTLKINGVTDQMISVPAPICRDYLSPESLSARLQCKFNKSHKFQIFDFVADLATELRVWQRAADEYLRIMTRHQQFSDLAEFLFFSYFLGEFSRSYASSPKSLESSLNTFCKRVLTQSRIVGIEKYQK